LKNKIGSTKKRKYISIGLLNAFTEKELEGFSKFVSYYYFNTDESLVTLLEQLRKRVIGKSVQLSDYEIKIYKNVFSDFDNSAELSYKQRKRLNSKLTVLTRLAEKFLCINALAENNFCSNELLYQALLDKKQYELFNRKINRERKRLHQVTLKDSSYYFRALKAEAHSFSFIYQNELMSTKDNLNEQMRYLDLYYIVEKLNLCISMLSFQATTQRSYNFETIELMWQLVNHPDYKDEPLIKAYNATIVLLKEQSETAYDRLIQILDDLKNKLSVNNLTTLYNIALNFCVQRLKIGEFTFQDLFEIYSKLDERDLLLEENYIPSNKLKNVLTVGCRIKKFQWAQDILSKYYPFIRKSVRENVYHFNMGAISFYQKKFNTALSHFIKVDHVNLTYDINCRIMMLKAHYEIDGDYDERTVQIYRSTEKYFLENKELSFQNRRAFKNFIRLLINLYRIKHKATKMTVASFQNKLEAQQINSDKNWLKEKLNEL